MNTIEKLLTWGPLKIFSKGYIYKEYKRINEIMDFNDLIKTLIRNKTRYLNLKLYLLMKHKTYLVLQWKLVDILKTKTEHMYLAGDDDQAIYAWAGFDVNRFITEPGKRNNFKTIKTY